MLPAVSSVCTEIFSLAWTAYVVYAAAYLHVYIFLYIYIRVRKAMKASGTDVWVDQVFELRPDSGKRSYRVHTRKDSCLSLRM